MDPVLEQQLRKCIGCVVAALFLVSLCSMNIFSIMFALSVACSMANPLKSQDSMCKIKCFYGVSLTYLIVVIIIFGSMLIVAAGTVVGTGESESSAGVAVLVVWSVLTFLTIVQLVLSIRLYVLVSNLVQPPLQAPPIHYPRPVSFPAPVGQEVYKPHAKFELYKEKTEMFSKSAPHFHGYPRPANNPPVL